MAVIVFDLGGTLMHYIDMPYSWADYYYQGLNTLSEKYISDLSVDKIQTAVNILKEFNPRINYREIEYSSEYIFSKALESWNLQIPVNECIETFWNGLKLKAEIFDDSISTMEELKRRGYTIAALTDLPNAMPDYIFKKDIDCLLDCFDFYVSSSIAGYRKPNPIGLKIISDKFSIPLSDLIFIGDEDKDKQTALRANCKFIKIDRTRTTNNCVNNLSDLLKSL